MDPAMSEVMSATVLRARRGELLVCDCATRREVVVHTDQACCFCPGDQVCIRYSGAMTNSLPPQISADTVTHMCCG